MSVEDDRRKALDQMLAQRGQTAIGANDRYYGEQIAPVMARPTSDRAAMLDKAWADRNSAVAASATANVGGYGAALNALRIQNEEEAARQEAAAKAKKGAGGRGSSGGGSSTPDVIDTAPVAADDPWAWVKDYVASNTYTGAPTPGQTGSRPTYTGGGKPAGVPAIGGSRRTPQPYSKPKVVSY